MKSKLFILAALQLALLAPTYTDTAAAADPKGMTAIKTDPVLKSSGSFAAPKAFSGLSLNFSTPEELTAFSLNFEPIMEMVALLEEKGSKVTAKLVEHGKITTLELSVDGRALDPLVVQCSACEIVFEY